MNVQFVLNPPKNIKDVIYSGLKAFNMQHFPSEDIHSLACYAEDENGDFVGGLTGEILKRNTKDDKNVTSMA